MEIQFTGALFQSNIYLQSYKSSDMNILVSALF